jgi:serine/threonine protein kinase
MSWPLSQDYNEAVQDPAGSFADAELRAGRAAVNALGLPMPRSGNFADVYQFHGADGNKWAVKCFTREVPGLHERYTAISKHLRRAKLPFTVDFKYLEQGIQVHGQWFPILKMDWVEGFLLNEFVRHNLDRPAVLDALGQIWLRLAKRLHDAGVAHADLQHGNVILVPGSRASALAVKLIDYDGMWVPALSHKKSGEVGHAAYQHPQRLEQGTYSAEVDRLPLLAISCALRALAVAGKPLWDRYDNGDNLLFREKDLRNPADSAVFRELWNIPDSLVHGLVGYVALGLRGPLDAVPLLEDLMPENRLQPLSPAQQQRLLRELGPGATIEPHTPPRPEPVTTFRADSPRSPSTGHTGPTGPDWESLTAEDAPVLPLKRRARKSALPWVISASLLLALAGGGAAFLLKGSSTNQEKPRQKLVERPRPPKKPHGNNPPADEIPVKVVVQDPPANNGQEDKVPEKPQHFEVKKLGNAPADPKRPVQASGLANDGELDCTGQGNWRPLGRNFDLGKSWELSFEIRLPDLTGGPRPIFSLGNQRTNLILVQQRGPFLEAGIGAKMKDPVTVSADLRRSLEKDWYKIRFRYLADSNDIELFDGRHLIERKRSLFVPGPIIPNVNTTFFNGEAQALFHQFGSKLRNVWLGNN